MKSFRGILRNGELDLRIITKKELDSSLEDKNNIVNIIYRRGVDNRIVRENTNSGRTEGTKEIPQELRAIIGVAAQFSTAREVAEAFDVSETSVNDFKHGRVGQKENSELSAIVSKDLSTIREKALDKLVASLDALDSDAINNAKPVDIATIASKMSRVAADLTPKDPTELNGAQIIIYAPQVKQENNYITKEV